MNLSTIIKLTLKTALNKRMIWLAVIAGTLLGLAALMLATISLDQNVRLVSDVLLTGIPVISIVISVVISAYMVLMEQEGGTLLMLLSKPVSRTAFIIGKLIGLIIASAIIMIIITTINLLIVWPIYKLSLLPILLSLYTSSLELYILVAVAVLFATISSPVISTLATAGIFVLGHQLELIYYAAILGGKFTGFLGSIVYYTLPNLEKYNLREYYNSALSLPASFYGWATVYALIYILFLLVLSVITIGKREW